MDRGRNIIEDIDESPDDICPTPAPLGQKEGLFRGSIDSMVEEVSTDDENK